MNVSSRRQEIRKGKRRIKYRLRDRTWPAQEQPMFRASNIHYEVADRTQAMGVGGIGAIHRMARRSGVEEGWGQSLISTTALRNAARGRSGVRA